MGTLCDLFCRAYPLEQAFLTSNIEYKIVSLANSRLSDMRTRSVVRIVTPIQISPVYMYCHILYFLLYFLYFLRYTYRAVREQHFYMYVIVVFSLLQIPLHCCTHGSVCHHWGWLRHLMYIQPDKFSDGCGCYSTYIFTAGR